VEADALVLVLPKNQRLAMLQLDHGVELAGLVRGIIPSVVVEDIAVLIDLDERSPFMLGGPLERLAQVLHVYVDRAGDERSLAADGNRQWIERIIDRAVR